MGLQFLVTQLSIHIIWAVRSLEDCNAIADRHVSECHVIGNRVPPLATQSTRLLNHQHRENAAGQVAAAGNVVDGTNIEPCEYR